MGILPKGLFFYRKIKIQPRFLWNLDGNDRDVCEPIGTLLQFQFLRKSVSLSFAIKISCGCSDLLSSPFGVFFFCVCMCVLPVLLGPMWEEVVGEGNIKNLVLMERARVR